MHDSIHTHITKIKTVLLFSGFYEIRNCRVLT